MRRISSIWRYILIFAVGVIIVALPTPQPPEPGTART
jgi:hypothetical protein